MCRVFLPAFGVLLIRSLLSHSSSFLWLLSFSCVITFHCRHAATTRWLITPGTKEDETLLILANILWNSSLWSRAKRLDHGWVLWSGELTGKSLEHVVFDAREYPGEYKQVKKSWSKGVRITPSKEFRKGIRVKKKKNGAETFSFKSVTYVFSADVSCNCVKQISAVKSSSSKCAWFISSYKSDKIAPIIRILNIDMKVWEQSTSLSCRSLIEVGPNGAQHKLM